jgi:hypothetical protein
MGLYFAALLFVMLLADSVEKVRQLSGPDLIPFPKLAAGDVLGSADSPTKSLRSLAPGKV